jgi:hypothetical protein
MNLQSQLKKSDLRHLKLTQSSKIYKSQKTLIESINTIYIFTTEFEKYQFYYYGLKNKFSCIPKIHQLIADDKHGVYYIERELLFPIIDTSKLDTIEKIKYYIINRLPGENVIAKELLAFYYQFQGSIDFDFGPHWIMETQKGKLVVSDAFRAIDERRTKNLSNNF